MELIGLVIEALLARLRGGPVGLAGSPTPRPHAVSPGEKAMLNGHILGVLDKGKTGKEGLRAWLSPVVAARIQPGLPT